MLANCCKEKPLVILSLLPLVLERILPDIVSHSLSVGADFYVSERTQTFFKFGSILVLKSLHALHETSGVNSLYDFVKIGR
jgi:hypothetical protein